jgi:uncharacterized protein (TIGR03437 family)
MQARQRVPSVVVIGLLLGWCAPAFAQGILVATPNSLTLSTSAGPTVTATVVLSTASTTAIPFTISAQGTTWLTVTPTKGTVAYQSTATVTITADSTGLQPGSYNVIVPISYNDPVKGPTTLGIPVTFNVVLINGLSASPAGVNWVYAPGGTSPSAVPITLTTSAGTFSAAVDQASTWLLLGVPGSAFSQSEINSFPTSGGFTLVFNSLAPLNPGANYTGQVTITDANGNITFVTVSLQVQGIGTAFSVAPNNVTFTTNPPLLSSTLTTTAPNPTFFTASATVTTPPGGNWLSVTPTGTTPQNITVTANPQGLPVGTYTGVVTLVAGINSSTVNVTFVVSTATVGGGNVVSSPSVINVSYQTGATLPLQPQTLAISDQSGSTPIPFTVSATGPAGSISWLTVGVAGGGTQGSTQTSSATVVVNINPQGLPPANYTGTVTITPQGGNAIGITVTLIVTGPSTVTASPLQLSFSYQTGGAVPPAQQIQVSGNAASLPFVVVTSTSSGANWLSAGTSGGTAPATLNVTVTPGTLTAGLYQGTITIAGAGIATGTTNIAVSLTITTPVILPSITSVENAASFATGPVAPGEIVSIFGTDLGPATPVGLTLDSTGKVSTNIGNTQVFFNGIAAPLTYVSATQINCVVPYEFANVTSPYVQVKYSGQGSNTPNLTQATTAPGIFAASAGQGQGAILNGDNSYNSSSNPAAKGSVIQLFMTGEGALSPAAVTGSVTCSAGCATLAQIPVPVQKVAATINGQPATITFFGEASGDVSGVLQVDLIIPPNTPSGAVPIVISIGGNNSQSGVTVSVQ